MRRVQWATAFVVAAAGVGVSALGMGGGMGGIGNLINQAASNVPGKVPFTVGKETTRIVGPLRADGTVDYVAAVNELLSKGVTPENNGFVLWLETVSGTGE